MRKLHFHSADPDQHHERGPWTPRCPSSQFATSLTTDMPMYRRLDIGYPMDCDTPLPALNHCVCTTPRGVDVVVQNWMRKPRENKPRQLIGHNQVVFRCGSYSKTAGVRSDRRCHGYSMGCGDALCPHYRNMTYSLVAKG